MNSDRLSRPIEILLVEDSPTDALMAQEAFEYSNLLNSLHLVENGVEALMFLRNEGKYAGAERPDMILLDLNLPKKSGREVLEEIKADNYLRTIPVIILSASKAEEDILKSYGDHANCYITKPIEFDKFVDAVRSIQNFWFKVVTLPPSSLA